MTLSLEFTVDGQPVPKGRPRLSTRSGFARAYTPAKTVQYERRVAAAAQAAMGTDREPIALPVAVRIRFSFQVPASWSKARKADALEGRTYPGRIDVDNVGKAVLDAMNGVVFLDDVQVVDLRVSKAYSTDPRAIVYVREVSDAHDDGRRGD